MDNQRMPFIRALSTVSKLLLLGGILAVLGVLGLALFLAQGDIGNAIGSGCVLAVGLVLLVVGFLRRQR